MTVVLEAVIPYDIQLWQEQYLYMSMMQDARVYQWPQNANM